MDTNSKIDNNFYSPDKLYFVSSITKESMKRKNRAGLGGFWGVGIVLAVLIIPPFFRPGYPRDSLYWGIGFLVFWLALSTFLTWRMQHYNEWDSVTFTPGEIRVDWVGLEQPTLIRPSELKYIRHRHLISGPMEGINNELRIKVHGRPVYRFYKFLENPREEQGRVTLLLFQFCKKNYGIEVLPGKQFAQSLRELPIEDILAYPSTEEFNRQMQYNFYAQAPLVIFWLQPLVSSLLVGVFFAQLSWLFGAHGFSWVIGLGVGGLFYAFQVIRSLKARKGVKRTEVYPVSIP